MNLQHGIYNMVCISVYDSLFQGYDHTLLLLSSRLDVTGDFGYVAGVQCSIDLHPKMTSELMCFKFE
jgi:hypothetical protein